MPDCPLSSQFIKKQKNNLLDLLNDFNKFCEVKIRTLIDDFGIEMKQQIIETQGILSFYLCKPMTLESFEEKLSEVINKQTSTLSKIETDSREGKAPNYEQLLFSWMMIINVQNDAIELKSELDKCKYKLHEMKLRVAIENNSYKFVPYGEEYIALSDCIISSAEEELNKGIGRWSSIYDRLDVYLAHLRGVIEFAEIQYSKGIQDETSLLNRIFLVGVIAQLIGMFSITVKGISSNFGDGLLLIGISVIPTLFLYYLIRHLIDLINQKKRNHLFKAGEFTMDNEGSIKNANQ
jgi:hypothetical protein